MLSQALANLFVVVLIDYGWLLTITACVLIYRMYKGTLYRFTTAVLFIASLSYLISFIIVVCVATPLPSGVEYSGWELGGESWVILGCSILEFMCYFQIRHFFRQLARAREIQNFLQDDSSSYEESNSDSSTEEDGSKSNIPL